MDDFDTLIDSNDTPDYFDAPIDEAIAEQITAAYEQEVTNLVEIKEQIQAANHYLSIISSLMAVVVVWGVARAIYKFFNGFTA